MASLCRALALALPLTGLLHSASVTATPLDSRDEMVRALMKRQDPSGIAPEDEDDAEIAADGTKPLRKAVDARSLYTNQATATWFQVSTGASDASASFTSFATSQPNSNGPPKPDQNQISGPNPWNVDHIFELQVIGEAFKADKPGNIPQGDWDSASSAVFTAGPENTAIAQAVTVLENLEGIPSALNSFKKQVFTQNLTGKGGPSSGNDATFFNFFGPAIQKYLQDNTGLLSGTVDTVGDKLASVGNNNNDVKSYFTSYADLHYSGCIDFLSTWTGKPTAPASTSATDTATATGAAVTTAAAVTCYHAADPQNTCAAIADSSGWCDCGDDNKYTEQTTGDPCAWTTLPPTTTFDCSTTPTSTCVVPDGCTNEAAPTGCAVACS